MILVRPHWYVQMHVYGLTHEEILEKALPYIPKRTNIYGSGTLSGMFVWENTSEGSAYWNKIHSNFIDKSEYPILNYCSLEEYMEAMINKKGL